MKYCEARSGRVFVVRLEDGEILHETIEKFALRHQIHSASLICLGGADAGSRLIAGPEEGRSQTITPNEIILDNVHEVVGTGTLFRNESNEPMLHMHLSCGRHRETVTGCVRRGVKVWHVMEIIIYELICGALRKRDEQTGFELLSP